MRSSSVLQKVMMNSLVAVLFLVAAALADPHPLPKHVRDLVLKEGEQYKLYEHYTSSIKLTEQHQKETFEGLNIHGKDQVVNKDDLDMFYWHEDLFYAVPKFLKFVDDNGDKEIRLDELKNEFQNKNVRVALSECPYLKSNGLKRSCFADQLATYASLVPDDDDVQKFEVFIGGTDGISKDDAEGIKHEKNQDNKATAEELGAYHGHDGVSREELKDYLTQPDIIDDFRRCRDGTPNVETGNVDFKNECLVKELVEYTNGHLTELDIAVMYHAVDLDGKHGISKAEIGKLPGVKDTPEAGKKVDKIMKLLDMSLTTPKGTEPVIDYGEFRTYMRSPTVLIQSERECTEPKTTQLEELNCLYDLFIKLVLHEHDAIWLVVPDLEQQISFEILDTTNDGEIRASELDFGDDKTQKRLIEEIDHDKSDYVCLEEWNYYMDIPHMVYGTGDCLMKHRAADGRGVCYTGEIKSMMGNLKEHGNDFWIKWFAFYDSDADNIVTRLDDNEAAHKFGSQDLEDLFLAEVGQGDDKITLFEFTWYAKQQEIAERYSAIVQAGNLHKVEEYHKEMINWIENDITEYDIQEFFRKLDPNGDHELEKKDFSQDLWPKMEALLKKIDAVDPHGDADETVNFREFWLWLNVQTNPGQEKKVFVKDIFENECTKKISGKNQQQQEIECYAKYFKEHAEELAKLC